MPDIEHTQRSGRADECPQAETPCPVIPVINEMRYTLSQISTELRDIRADQERHGIKLSSLEDSAKKAHAVANDAKRTANESRDQVADIVQGVRAHTDGLAKTLAAHGVTLAQQVSILKQHTETLESQNKILNGLNATSEKQDAVFTRLTESELRRSIREETAEKYQKKSTEWVRWGVLTGGGVFFTLVTTIVGILVWFFTHVPVKG